MTGRRAITKARRERAASERALEKFHDAIREAADAGVTRRELADAVGLSPSRIQQIVAANGSSS